MRGPPVFKEVLNEAKSLNVVEMEKLSSAKVGGSEDDGIGSMAIVSAAGF